MFTLRITACALGHKEGFSMNRVSMPNMLMTIDGVGVLWVVPGVFKK